MTKETKSYQNQDPDSEDDEIVGENNSRRWQSRTLLSRGRNRSFNRILEALRSIIYRLKLSQDVANLCAQIGRKAVMNRIRAGRSTKALAGAIVHASCRIKRVAVSLDDIALHAGTTTKSVGQSYRHLVRQLDLKIPVPSPLTFLPRIASELGIPNSIKKTAREILEMAEEQNLIMGRSPWGMAAAAVYLASLKEGRTLTQYEVARAAGVTEVTVRNRYKELLKKLNLKEKGWLSN